MKRVLLLLAAAREAGVRVIPQINLLGHQSWACSTGSLLRSHPEFDETHGKYPNNEGMYCRSDFPLHPEIQGVVFDLIEEIADALRRRHGRGLPPRRGRLPALQGKNRAELFAVEVRAIHDHLALTNQADDVDVGRPLPRR